MSELATTLRMAREAKGLTIEQISERTHVMSCVLRGLENDDFSRIPAPIYGRGFVRLFCENVGIADPRPLVEAFTRLYNGEEEPAMTSAPAAPVAQTEESEREPMAAAESAIAEPAGKPEPISAAEPPAATELRGLSPSAPDERDFHLESESLAKVPSFDEVPPPPAAPAPGANDLPTEPTSLSRYASPLHTFTHPKIHPAVWRIALLVIIGGAFLALVVMGVRALYRATTPSDDGGRNVPVSVQDAPTPSRSQAAPAKAAKPEPERSAAATSPRPRKSSRTPQKIAPLYLD